MEDKFKIDFNNDIYDEIYEGNLKSINHRDSFSSLSIIKIEEIKEEYFKPYIVINPIFTEVNKITLLDIIKNTSIGYIHNEK